ncbi:MAG: 1-deoxy-D-xylulose-5-phosphate synthase [Clostridia bacterium]|nr:1-deoxy-D-xylulose-5-phosphate synthase [Clostridia bacterium]
MPKFCTTDIKNFTKDELKNLCERLREIIKSTVMHKGGHLSSNLGVIELTVALHYVFDFPEDKLIFDVGHQCYAHKLLSGREDKFDSLRQRGGLSGFPKREESEYDCYNTGHAGTSVSAALGFAKARDIQGENFNVIALIGDGSFNNGLVYEAFNSLRPLNTNILVILNDNGMSISPTVGSMHEYLEQLSRDDVHRQKVEKHSNIFERFGFSYDGVYDGNDLDCMIKKLTEIKEKLKTQSVILHILTKKGKGYSFCEEHPQQTHGITGNEKSVSQSYSEVFGKTLTELAAKDKSIVAVTAAMTPSLGLSDFFEKYSERAIDVGICEEHATILCASLAAQGLKPYYAVYSTFLQRSFDEIIIDICSQRLPVTLCIDRAGISGEDGETHQGVFDLSFLNMIPELTIAVPKDVNELRQMVIASADFKAPLAIRYPKECNTVFESEESELRIGAWEILKRGNGNIAILACGERAISLAFEVCKELNSSKVNPTVVNARFVKPLDVDTLKDLKENLIITIEDNQLIGGFGSSVSAYFSDNKEVRVKNFAYADKFIPHGTAKELAEEFGLSMLAIVDYVMKNAVR